MIKKIEVEIDGVNYSLPKEITTNHYGEMMRRMSFSDTDLERAYDVVGTIMNVPYSVLRELDPEKLADLSVYIQHKIMECDIPYQQTFKFNKVDYIGVVLNKMTFGEYIDVVCFIKDDLTIFSNIHKICALLYRPVVNGKIVPYNVEQHEIQSELFKTLPVKYFFGIFKNLFLYLKQMRKDFEVLFGAEDDKRLIEGEEVKNDLDNSNLPWYRMIMVLANDDFTKIDYITGRPVVECFNHLTYISIKNEEANKRAAVQQAKMNLYE